MDEKKEQETFSVKDRRRFVVDEAGEAKPDQNVTVDDSAASATPGEPREQQTKQKTSHADEENTPLPEVNFSSFIISLSQAALLHLGLFDNPTTKTRERNLPLAKHTIDTIALFEEKTKGNLTKDEEMLLENLLTDLRLRYVNEANK
ncbi:MAG: DUF1844 domain-containing protein [Deltaproteobacteria bacterium]|nr:DUF1844 domain-containing protein [Deltaproteobacteria bacterium]